MEERTISLLVGIIFFFYGISMLVHLINVKRKEGAAMSWPSVTGQVIRTDVSRDCDGAPAGKCFKPIIRYRYDVHGTTYESEIIRAGKQVMYPHVALAEKHVARYPAGSEVAVYYNPEKRNSACIERKATSHRRLAIMSGVSFLLGILFFLGVLKV